MTTDKNSVTYYRLMKNDHFVGFRRVVVEYLTLTSDKWQLSNIEYDHAERLSRPAVGISSLKRPSLRQVDRRHGQTARDRQANLSKRSKQR